MTFTTDRRVARMRQVLDQRLQHVSVAVEALYHRHNVSAVLRTVDALGLHRVHLVEGHFKAVRGTSRGAERWLELNHHPSPEAAIARIRADGYAVWCADLADDAEATTWLLDHGADPDLRHDFGGAEHGTGAVAMHLAAQ